MLGFSFKIFFGTHTHVKLILPHLFMYFAYSGTLISCLIYDIFALQINGVDVHNRDQAIKLFSANSTDTTLLVTRPQLQVNLINFSINTCSLLGQIFGER